MPLSRPGPAYRIETERLVIRCYNPADAPLLKASIDASIDHLLPWMPWAADEPQEIDAKIELLRSFRGKFDLGQDFIYGVFNREESKLLGGTGLHTRAGPNAREIGYWIHAHYINQGLATETSAALVKVAFEVDGVDRVEIHCDPQNLRSAAVPRKLGFQHETTLRRRTPRGDDMTDSMIWTLFAADYPNSPAAGATILAYDALHRSLLSPSPPSEM